MGLSPTLEAANPKGFLGIFGASRGLILQQDLRCQVSCGLHVSPAIDGFMMFYVVIRQLETYHLWRIYTIK